MKTKIFAILLSALTLTGCKDDFLEKPPLDQLANDSFWTNENNVRTFAYEFYTNQFIGYGSGNTWGNFFSGQSLNDDFAPVTPTEYVRVVPANVGTASAANGGWNFTFVRRANLFIGRVQEMPVNVTFDEAAQKHWIGVGRFFRALEYFSLVKRFGDVPWYDNVLLETDRAELYKPRDSRTFVMDKMLEDFRYAAEHVRVADGARGLVVNKDVVLAFMSRVFLFEGAWQKYHLNNSGKAAEYFEAAKWAANEVIVSGRYSLGNYRAAFSSLDLAGNPEMILYRQYEPGVLTHALMSYNNREAQTGATKDVIETYLASDGLPISISPLYQGDRGIQNVMANRDPRIKETFVSNQLRLQGVIPNFSTTGYATHKFLNESIKDESIGSLNLNPTDAPIIRFGEVLVNYAEAAAELATVGGPALDQADLDKSINKLRARPGIGLPALQVVGNQPAVNGVPYNDPQRDQSVPAMIWEIRRERRVELIFEGFRFDDLRRWKKLEYTDTQANPEINRGAWVRKADYPGLNESVVLDNGQEGYIIPASRPEVQRIFTDPKIYLFPIPQDQITLYQAQGGVQLRQNPGW